jgi:hypothetical protein
MSKALNIGVRIGLRPNAVMRADKGEEFCWLALEERGEFDQPILIFPPKGVTYDDLLLVAQAFNDMVAKARKLEDAA